MEFTHTESSLIIHAVNDYLESIEERYEQLICMLEEGFLISPLALEKTEEMLEKSSVVFDIQEKVFSTHPCPKAKEMLLEELKENREKLAKSQVFLASLVLYHSPSSEDEDKGCNESEGCSLANAKSPENPNIEKVNG